MTISRGVPKRKCLHGASVAAAAVTSYAEEVDVSCECVDYDDDVSEILGDIDGNNRVLRDSLH